MGVIVVGAEGPGQAARVADEADALDVPAPAGVPRAGARYLTWARAEVGRADLGDLRRTGAAVRVLAALAAQPGAPLPQAGGDRATTKAAYRLFDLPERYPDLGLPAALRAAHQRATKARLAAAGRRTVLAVQDTTDLDETAHPATTGVGPLETARRRGLFVHSTLAVTLDGTPQGLLAQQVWARDPAAVGQRHRRKQRPIEEKESSKWLAALAEGRADLPETVTLVHVGDREADVYDLFVAAAQVPGTALLVRACRDRRTRGPAGETGHVWADLRARPVADTRTLGLPRRPGQAPREARLTLRWQRVTLQPPRRAAAAGGPLPPLALDALLVEEVDAPAGATPLRWCLLTSVPVTDRTSAWERVRWYTLRWRVERYHLVLKSGCRLEQRRFGTAGRLEAALALYGIVACRVLQLTYAARATPDAPATALLAPDEWALLWAARHPDDPLPTTAEPTVREAVRELAGLGGFLGRRGDGDPGAITLWRGVARFHDLLLGYHLAQRRPTLNVGQR
jgi:hypothetical protein